MARGHQAVQSQQKNAEKKAKLAKQQGNSSVDALKKQQLESPKCKLCMAPQTQLSKVYEVAMQRLNEHVSAKHPKNTIGDCFPEYTAEAQAGAAEAAAQAADAASKEPQYKPDKVAGVKKKQTHKRG